MYQQLSEKRTKQHYIELLNETVFIAEKRLLQEKSTLWNSIVNQLHDIKKMVVEEHVYQGWEDIYDHYTLGTIAVHEFSDDDEMQARLCDLFSGAIDYHSMPEE